MHYSIKGDTSPVLICELTEGESLITQYQSMGWMSDHFKITPNVKRGLINSISKIFSYNTPFLNSYTCYKDFGTIAFPLNFPGKIIAKNLDYDESIICKRSSFIAASDSISIEMFNKKSIAFNLNNKECIFQKITGPGIVFFGLNGYSQEFILSKDEKLKVDIGNLVLFDSYIDLNLSTIKGFKNIFLDDEDTSLITLTGPGRVHVQSISTKTAFTKHIKHLPLNEK